MASKEASTSSTKHYFFFFRTEHSKKKKNHLLLRFSYVTAREMGLVLYPTSQIMLERKRRPLQGGVLSGRWWASESKQKEPPHGRGLGVKAEASFRWEPEGTGVWRCSQGRVRSALQSWGCGPQTHHEETLRISPPRPARPMLVEEPASSFRE